MASPDSSDQQLSTTDFSLVSAEVLGAIPFPALVLAMPSELIVAASPAATALIDPAGGMIVGHALEDFTSDRPILGSDRFAGGRLNGFETFRVLRRTNGADAKVRLWIRSFAHETSSDFVVVVIVADAPDPAIPSGVDWQDAPAVFGTADADLIIERLSNDAEDLFDRPVSDLLGGSLLDLVDPEDVARCHAALDEASTLDAGITLHLNTRANSAAPAPRCEVVILPLQPAPSCAFVFLPIPAGDGPQPHVSAELSAILLRLGRGAEVARLARGVFRGVTERSVPGLSRLSTRELEVVSFLLDGDRPPAIAAKLFVTQSTVRNHLGSVFAKLGLSSQQELVDVFRRAAGSAIGGRPGSPTG